MGKIAIAGGSTGIGRAIADVLESAKTHEYIILSRRSSDLETRAVDYSNIEALTELFEREQIDTVISTLSINDDQCGQAQMNLIEAANRSACTKRFLPSEFGMFYTPENIGFVPQYRWKLQAVDALKQTNLEFSQISIGLFLDYWSLSRIPTRLSSTTNMWLDAENNAAVIPGDGNDLMVLTHSSDAARHVVSLLDIPDWKRRYFVVGTRTTLNDAVKLAEEVKGVKFNVCYDSVKSLQKGEANLTPSTKAALPSDESLQSKFKGMAAQVGLVLTRGGLDLNPEEGVTLEFPNVKPLTIREVFEAWR